MAEDEEPTGNGFYFGPGVKSIMIDCVAGGNGGHGVYVAPGASALMMGMVSVNNGGDGIHIAATAGEVEALIDKMPEQAKGPWLNMLQDAVSGATGGLTVEGVKALVVAALTSMGLSS